MGHLENRERRTGHGILICRRIQAVAKELLSGVTSGGGLVATTVCEGDGVYAVGVDDDHALPGRLRVTAQFARWMPELYREAQLLEGSLLEE